jgi:hypothetical protein
MKRLFETRWGFAPLVLAIAIQPLAAQNAGTKTVYVPFHYRQSDEISVSGVVSSVPARSAKSTVNGSHLTLATSLGTVDVSLGPWAMFGPNHLSLSAGDEVSIKGVLTTVNQKQILLARTVKADGQVYSIRNEHGVALPPQARLRGSAVSRNGGAQ